MPLIKMQIFRSTEAIQASSLTQTSIDARPVTDTTISEHYIVTLLSLTKNVIVPTKYKCQM